jgi:RimJ/RimL family protein N-acetyltransferase
MHDDILRPLMDRTMQPPHNARPRKKDLWFQSGRYFLRTIRREDASERWAGWLADPVTVYVLNSESRRMEKKEVVDYIKQFDQRSQLLLGIFERGTRLHVGFIRLDIDEAAKEARVNAVIGESEHRNRGATTNVFVPLLDFIFYELGLEKVRAPILKRNQITLQYLLKLGWEIDEGSETQVRSKTDGALLGVMSVSWTADGYRAFRRTRAGKRILQRIFDAERGRTSRPPASE